jgi:hypothetical protein
MLSGRDEVLNCGKLVYLGERERVCVCVLCRV